MNYPQSSAERHHNLVMKFVYLKYFDGVDPFNTSGVDGGKEIKQGKSGLDVTSVITYKTPLVVD